jgi:hypothetical protein
MPNKSLPTLADAVSKWMTRPENKILLPIRETLMGAKRFVLDDATDLSTAAVFSKPAKCIEILDEMCREARVPFKRTWIEMNLPAFMQRTRSEYKTFMELPGSSAARRCFAWEP